MSLDYVPGMRVCVNKHTAQTSPGLEQCAASSKFAYCSKACQKLKKLKCKMKLRPWQRRGRETRHLLKVSWIVLLHACLTVEPPRATAQSAPRGGGCGAGGQRGAGKMLRRLL